MSSYKPPIEDITEFNSSLFNQPEVNLTQGQADLLYLSKTKNDTSTASLTTFNGNVTINGTTGLTCSTSTPLFCRNINAINPAAGGNIFPNATAGSFINFGSGDSTISVKGQTFFDKKVVIGTGPDDFNLYPTLGTNNTVIGITTAGANLTATSASNVIIGNAAGQSLTTGGSNVMLGTGSDTSLGASNVVCIGNVAVNKGGNAVSIGNSATSSGTGSFNTLVGTNTTAASGANPNSGVALGRSANFSGNNAVSVGYNASVLSTSTDNIAIGTSATITAGTGASSIAIGNGATINANISNSVALGNGAVASVSNTIVLGRTTETIIIPNRIQFTPATYSFPFASNQQLGYYLKTTGTATSVTTATPTSIVTTASIPVGVWRIDFSVQNVVGASGAGTITQAQSYVSNTLNGNVGTAVAFTGSVVRSHVSEVYANNDVQIITSSLTYQQSTAGVIYLNIVRSFATGTYSFTGELSVTRIA
jgi:hypothetical protein